MAASDAHVDDLLRWSEALAGVARTGLAYSASLYERERFEEILRIAADIRVAADGGEVTRAASEALAHDWRREVRAGTYPTPRVAVGAVVGNERGEILLVHRPDSGYWLYPTGWADVGYSAAEVAVKEVAEETGLEVEPVRLILVLDGLRIGISRSPLYSLVFHCHLVGGDLEPHPLECLDVGWFARDALPSPLAGAHGWVDQAFAAIDGEAVEVLFDRPRLSVVAPAEALKAIPAPARGPRYPGPMHMRSGGGAKVMSAAFAAGLLVFVSTPLIAGAAAAKSVPGTARSTPSGCGKSAASGSTTLTLNVNSFERTVIVHVPTGYSGQKKVALVLNLHGSGSTAAEQEGFTGMDATSDANGFIVAYPQGRIPDGTGFDWNVPGVPLVGGRAVPKNAANDVKFIVKLVAILEQRYCVDPHRVYATGFSGGARLTSTLACTESNLFAAFAPVSGLRRPTPCPTTRAVPILSFHGTADPVDPYNGHGEAYWTYSVPDAAHDWAIQDHCSTQAHTTSGAGYHLAVYSGCADKAVVELYTITDEGHEWPGGPHLPRLITLGLGPQSNAVNADTTIWHFFAAHPLP